MHGNPINQSSSFSLSRASRLALRYLNCSFLRRSSKKIEIGLIGQVAFDYALATALASVSSVLLTIGWGLVGSNALSRWNMLFLRVSCSLGHFSSTDLVLGLELDLLKSFSTSGWFSYPELVISHMEMPCLLLHNQTRFSNQICQQQHKTHFSRELQNRQSRP